MKTLVEVHILQNVAPANLNRDDTGAPKDAFFGGFRRARVSSQCWKRAMRDYVREHHLLSENRLALRTKRIGELLLRALEEQGRPGEEAERVIRLALSGLALQLDEEGKSQYLFFLGREELDAVARAINDHWDDLLRLSEKEEKGQKKKEAKTLVTKELKELVKKLKDSLDGGKAVDLALFGRMLADLPEKNVDAACQVAHAISIHKVEKEFDYYTAVDDLTPEDTSGAGMIGTVEFNSACFYRYLNVNVEKLLDNLQGDWELTLAGLKAFLEAVVESMPTGKQNSFAAYNLPEFVAVAVRSGAPRNLATAFEKPVYVKMADNRSLTAKGVEAFLDKWTQYSEAYGNSGELFVLDLTGVWNDGGKKVGSLDALLERVVESVKSVAAKGG